MTGLLATRRLRAGPLLAAALATVTVMGLSGLMTEIGPWSQALRVPPWKPPDWAFGPIWTVIFALWTIAASLAWIEAPDRAARVWMVVSLAVNGVLNVLWSALFFHLRHPDWALWEVGLLWLSIVFAIMALWRCSTLAALLLAPYLGWVSVAALLTREIARLNGPF